MRSGHCIHFVLAIMLAGLFLACQKNDAGIVSSTIKTPSMICQTCVTAVTKAVSAVDGVQDVSVDLKSKTILVQYASAKTSVTAIETAIVNAGYDANDRKRDAESYAKLPACCRKDI